MSFRAAVSLYSILCSLKKQQTRKSWNQQLQPFECVSLDVFCSCVWAFYSRVKRVATWSSRCALTSLCRHTYMQCVWFVWAQIRKTDVKLMKKRRPCVLSNLSTVSFLVSLHCLQKLIILFPPAKYDFNFVSLNAFVSKAATSAVIVGHSSNDLKFFIDLTFRASISFWRFANDQRCFIYYS